MGISEHSLTSRAEVFQKWVSRHPVVKPNKIFLSATYSLRCPLACHYHLTLLQGLKMCQQGTQRNVKISMSAISTQILLELEIWLFAFLFSAFQWGGSACDGGLSERKLPVFQHSHHREDLLRSCCQRAHRSCPRSFGSPNHRHIPGKVQVIAMTMQVNSGSSHISKAIQMLIICF